MSWSNSLLNEQSVVEIRQSNSFSGEHASLCHPISSVEEIFPSKSYAGEFLHSESFPGEGEGEGGELLHLSENHTSLGEILHSENFPGEREELLHLSENNTSVGAFQKIINTSLGEIFQGESFPGEGEGDEHVVDIDFQNDICPCVFRVPKSLSEAKPEAYGPQKLGLGPFHHLRQDLYTMHTKKLADVIKFLDDDEKGDEKIERVMKSLEEREYSIRTSYVECFDLDRPTLARILAIDAIYLLTYFQESSDNINIDPEMKKKLVADILMLENQIPGNLLLEIWGILKRGDEDAALSKKLLSFCDQESPLNFTKPPIDVLPLMREGHLLNVLYNLILPNDGWIETKQRATKERRRTLEQAHKEAKIAAAIGVPGAKEIAAQISAKLAERSRRRRPVPMARKAFQAWAPPGKVDLAPMVDFASLIAGAHTGDIIKKEVSIMQKVPWPLLLNKLKKFDPDCKENYIASVSNLVRYARIKFVPVNGGDGIRNVELKGREFYLPVITLHSNSEVILRNLLAYEAAITKPGSTLEFAEYVHLMCGIVNTSKDVKILHEAKIIDSDLKYAEIARIFKEIWRSTKNEDEDEDEDEDKQKMKKTNIGKAIEEANKLYDSSARVKAYRSMMKYFYKSWKFLAVLSSVLALMLLALQAFCEIYDCNKHWLSTNSIKYNPIQVL